VGLASAVAHLLLQLNDLFDALVSMLALRRDELVACLRVAVEEARIDLASRQKIGE